MFIGKKEKKVEFIELVYDLVFVFIIGRNNSLLHVVKDGVVDWRMFISYVLVTLAIIQIWNFSNFYINRYGNNRVRDYIFLFINMYLLYFMADGTKANWHSDFNQYQVAWGLILLNIAIQYIIEYRHHLDAPWELAQIKRTIAILSIEAIMIFAFIPVHHATGFLGAPIAIAFGIIATLISSNINNLVVVDFAHLTERAMLYVVLTFGEMIIAIAGYFTGKINATNIYFSIMGFLVVVGMFLSYGKVYNEIIDKRISTNGTGYMMIHVILIFALNNISVALEFMREPEVNLLFKTLFLTGSIILYYLFLFLTERYAKERLKPTKSFLAITTLMSVGFIVLMVVFMNVMYVNIAITVAYVFGIYLFIRRFAKCIND